MGMNMKKSKLFFYLVLLLILFLAFYFNKNADLVYVKIGDFYYRNNQIEKAQKYYEKSFALGNNDEILRDVYVNSLINSPLTLESQMKLVKIATGDVRDSAKLKAEEFLTELKQEIFNKYSHNYIQQAPYNQKIVRWSKFPITYSFVTSKNVPKEYIEEIENAFTEWEKCGVVLFTKVDGDADIKISFINNKEEKTDREQKYVVAYTVPQINLTQLERMDIYFDLYSPDGILYTRNQIYNIALHEIFHALGFLGHSMDKDSLMYISSDKEILKNDLRRELREEDKETLKLLYKIKPDITNDGELKSEYLSYLVLGDSEDISASKTLEAKHYINQAPNLPSGYVTLAESYVAKGEYSKAIKVLERALNLATTSEIKYILYYDLAISYFYINNMDMSLFYVNQASNINDAEELHYLYAEIYLKKDDLQNAIYEYNKLIKFSPNNIDYVVNLANIYAKERNYLAAREVLKKYLKNNPSQKNNKKLSPYKMLLF